MKTLPRGIRNNNPFNLIITKDPWQGLEKEQNDPRFFQFESGVYGIRAGMRTLITYQDRHQRQTVRAIISAFAPAGENDTEAYIKAVCAHMGVKDDDVLDMHNYHDLRAISEAIIEHENGGPWATWYKENELIKAMTLAGVEAPRRPLAVNGQIVGSAIAGTAAAIGPIAQDAQSNLTPYVEFPWVKTAVTVLGLIGALAVIVNKYNERKKGIS